MIDQVSVITGNHARYYTYRMSGQTVVNLLAGQSALDTLWAPIANYIEPWQCSSVLAIAAWECSTEVISVVFDPDKSIAWTKARTYAKDLPYSPLFHEYLYEGNWIVSTLRARAIA